MSGLQPCPRYKTKRSRVWTVDMILNFCETVPHSGCWLWTKGTSSNGYGVTSRDNRQVRVHRLSHELSTGETPAVVRHKCDTPLCCNPDHLEGGIHADNMRDRAKRTGGSKWSNREVAEMRAAFECGESEASISDRTGIRIDYLRQILTRERRNHV